MDTPKGFNKLAKEWGGLDEPLTLEKLTGYLKGIALTPETGYIRDIPLGPKAIGFNAQFTINYTSKKELKKQLATSGWLTKSISKRSRIRMKLALKYGKFFK